MGIFEFIGQTITNATSAYIDPVIGDLIAATKITCVSGVALYLTLMGYSIMTGAIQAPFRTFLKTCLKLIIITAFICSADAYNGLVVDTLKGFESGLASIMTKGSVSSVMGMTNDENSSSIYQYIDQYVDKGINNFKLCFNQVSIIDGLGNALSWVCVGMIVLICTICITVFGGATIIASKFFIGILFAVGPLFIASLMFPVTAKFFDSWLSQVLNYIFTVVLIAVVMAFAMVSFDQVLGSSFDEYNASLSAAGAGGAPSSDPAPIIAEGGDPSFATAGQVNSDLKAPTAAIANLAILTFVFVWIIFHAGHVASGLAGGIAMQAIQARHLLMPATAAGRAHSLLNPASTRINPTTGDPTRSRQLTHAAMGRTLLSPAYRRAALDNLQKTLKDNWRPPGGTVSNS